MACDREPLWLVRVQELHVASKGSTHLPEAHGPRSSLLALHPLDVQRIGCCVLLLCLDHGCRRKASKRHTSHTDARVSVHKMRDERRAFAASTAT